MVRPKATSKKSQKKKGGGGGVDFKKYKRKLGRKLPPPKNATNTEIKSKAIILPEQSMASEREGLAVSKKGLTLKELLQQTSHHNAKVRRDALIGIKDLASKFPEELKLHKLAIIEKLRERISDEDRVVRETLYQLLKSTIFPAYKDETPGPIISLIMAYIFNAMTHLAFDIRMVAFKFFELVVQHYPSSFLLYAEKVLQNYEDLLKKNRFTSEDKSKLKNALLGLVRCLSLFPSTMGKSNRSLEKNTDAQGTLHAFEPEVPQDYADISSVVIRMEGLMPILVNYFQELTPSVLVMPVVDSQSFECMLCVLQSIDLALKYFIYGTSMLQTDFEVSVSCTYGGYDVTVWGATLPVLFKKLLKVFPLIPNHHPTEKNDERYYILNVAIAEIFLHLNEWIDTSSILMEKILDFVENAFSGKICSNKAVREKHLVPLLPFITKLVSQNVSSWKYRLLQAFTEAFKGCNPESSIKLAFLCAIEEMVLPSNRYGTQFIDASDSEIVSFQIAWMRELPTLLVQLGDRHPSSSKIVLRLLLRLGQHAPVGSSLAQEYDNMQYPLIEFYCTFREDSNDQGGVQYGPFIMLPRDCQDLAICSLYYFSRWDSLLLKSLTYSCL
ncbi:hypothetical protein IFM89_025075 [Coptis chinensis]|uniref:Pre-rRNA-processing protein Ipi1 N-terminal domain-containing protein n=1 Tax=Coptis chinensis TaxID=261450 RepID=A0A835M0N1_9MAGN|nr:hypothetical protein IFM89_025075 [Coptis chinensis]